METYRDKLNAKIGTLAEEAKGEPSAAIVLFTLSSALHAGQDDYLARETIYIAQILHADATNRLQQAQEGQR